MPNTSPVPLNLVTKLKDNRTLVLGVVAVLIAAGSFYVIQNARQTREIPLFEGAAFNETDLSRAQIAFGKSKLNDFKIENDQILVPLNRRGEYLAALEKYDAIPKAFQMPQKMDTSFLKSKHVQQWEQREAKRKRLNRMIVQLPFVHEAWLDFDEAQTQGLSPQIQRSIVVAVKKTGPDEFLGMLEVLTIRKLVRGSIAGIENKDIVITDINAGLSYSGDNVVDEHKLNGSLAIQVHLNEIRQAVSKALASYEGLTIDVTSQLSKTTLMKTVSLLKPPAGKPTGGANQPFSITHDSGSAILNADLHQEFPVNVTVTVSNTTIENVIAASNISRSTKLENSQQAFAQLKPRIYELVKSAVEMENDNRENVFEIVADPKIFTANHSESTALISAADWKTLTKWITANWIPLMLITAAVICILILLRKNPAVKNQWKSSSPNQQQLQVRPAVTTVSRSTVPESARQPMELPQDKQLRHEISEFIQSHPDQATDILQDWMKDAA